MHRKDPGTVLLLVGGGERDDALKNQIREKVNRLGLSDAVQFLGVREDVEELYQAFDLFLLPSLFEGLPVTMVEDRKCKSNSFAGKSKTMGRKCIRIFKSISKKRYF